MSGHRFERKWSGPTFGRECGSCYACCVYLGVEELKKYTGQTCKHLSGVDATKRCSIYDKRPHACKIYECVWRAGFGPDNLRPNESGILITMYPSERVEGEVAATVVIIDEDKAKATNPTDVVTELMMIHESINEVRLVNYKNKTALLFTNGCIYRCKLLPPDGYEALIFNADISQPVGRYEVRHE